MSFWLIIFLAFCVAVTITGIVAKFVRYLENRHWHDYKIYRTQPGQWTSGGGFATQVYARCECGKLDNWTIDGHYTVEELTGEAFKENHDTR